MSLWAELRELTLEITQECMNKCMHCSSMAVRRTKMAPVSAVLVKRVVDEASDLGLRSLAISGGEPFIHPGFVSVLKACAAKDLERLAVYTSGVLRSSDGAAIALADNALLDAVKDSCAWLIFNIQSVLPEVHDKIVGAPGRLLITLASMQNAIAHGIPVECHIVPNKQNVDSLATTARHLTALGAQRISFLRLVPQGYAEDNFDSLVCSEQEEERMKEAFRSLLQDENAHTKYRFGVPFSWTCGPPALCQAGISKLIMRWDGAFFPCEAFKECNREEFRLGNAYEDSLRAVLNRAIDCSALRSLRGGITGEDPCPAQSLYSVCSGG